MSKAQKHSPRTSYRVCSASYWIGLSKTRAGYPAPTVTTLSNAWVFLGIQGMAHEPPLPRSSVGYEVLSLYPCPLYVARGTGGNLNYIL
jgi:hypothetical protein